MADDTAPDQRPTDLAEAALRVLAREGRHGLTHRAVDDEAGVPAGTAATCFRDGPALLGAVAERIAGQLAPGGARRAPPPCRRPLSHRGWSSRPTSATSCIASPTTGTS